MVFQPIFEGFTLTPRVPRTYDAQAPLTPWYLDPESGGPNPEIKKAGVKYEDESED